MQRIARFSVVVGIAAALGLAGLMSVNPAGAAPARSAAPTSGYVENGSDNPVVAAPPVTRPDTAHCTVSLASHFLSNSADGTPQNFSGTLTPPAACPGPWNKVVLDYSVSVSGRQYDRIGNVTIGGATVYWFTTQEPSGPVPISYTVSKDVTEYTALLRSPQSFSGGIGNYTSSVYTGNYDQTVSLTYYRTDRTHPAPTVPDAVIGMPTQSLSPGTPAGTVALPALPRNITRAYLETTLEGGGCDEQWFTAVPDELSAKYPDAGLCGHGPYREADFTLDGAPLASVHTFPHIYSGGIVPTLWRPILAIDTLNLRHEVTDVTPFVGRLTDGGAHQVGVTIPNLGDSWSVVPVLLLYTDQHAARTSGAVVRNTTAPAATPTSTVSAINGGWRATTSAARHDVTSGYVDTSAGRVYTTVDRTMNYRNTDDVTSGGLAQHVVQSDHGGQTSTATIGGRLVAGTTHSYDYPITISYSAADYVDDQNFALSGSVRMSQGLTDRSFAGSRWAPPRASREQVDSTGVLARTNGVNTTSDGHSTSYYVGTDDLGRPYVHYLASNHGRVTKNLVVGADR